MSPKRAFTGVGAIQKAIVIFQFFVDGRHEFAGGDQGLVAHEDVVSTVLESR